MAIVAAYMVPHPPMIIPQIGRGNEKQVQKTIDAYVHVAKEIAELKPDTVLISSPHAVMYADYFHISPRDQAKGSFTAFGVPGVEIQACYDREFTDMVSELAKQKGFPAGTLGEKDRALDHGTMVPLWFIQNQFQDFKLVRTGLSGLDLTKHYEFGMLLREVSDLLGRRVVYVASGDLSHKLKEYGPYGFAKEGPEYDDRIMNAASQAQFGELFDFEESFCEKAAECGHRSFVIMAGALDGMAVEARRLSHEDVTGVGYGICTFRPKEMDEHRHFLTRKLEEQEKVLTEQREKSDEYVKLARASAEHFVKTGRVIQIPEWVSGELMNKMAGVFVSVHEHGRLRGCIGTIAPVRSCLAEEIIRNAVSAVSEDPRFDPVEETELKWLEINVDVLEEPESVDSMQELDVKRYGVIVQCGSKRGLLLPDLDGVDTVEQQVDIAMRKAGISKGSKVELQRFEVVRHY